MIRSSRASRTTTRAAITAAALASLAANGLANANVVFGLLIDPTSTAGAGATSTRSGPGSWQLYALDTSTTDLGISTYQTTLSNTSAINNRSPATTIYDPFGDPYPAGFTLLRSGTNANPVQASQPIGGGSPYLITGFGQTASSFAAKAASDPGAVVGGPTTSGTWGGPYTTDSRMATWLASLETPNVPVFLAEGLYSGGSPAITSSFANIYTTTAGNTASTVSVNQIMGPETQPPVPPAPPSNVSSEWRASFRGAQLSGDWSDVEHWTGAVPNGTAAVANLLGHSSLIGDLTVTLTASTTLRTLNLYDGAAGVDYTIAGPSSGAAMLHLGANGNSATIDAFRGNHNVTARLSLDENTRISVYQLADRLALTNLQSSTKNLTKAGSGTLEVNRVQAGAFTVEGGKLQVKQNSSPTLGTSKVTSLSVVRDRYYPAQLDLTNNKLIVTNTAVGAYSAQGYAGLTGLIKSGRNYAAWNGQGIITSMSDALSNRTTLAIAKAGEALGLGSTATKLWGGQTVSSGDALIMYTYAGDLNVDGVVNADDYAYIDLYSRSSAAPSYLHGDINYDGAINADDYALIDSNSINGGPPIGVRPAAETTVSLTSVPEPMLGIAFAAIPLVLSRTRRNRK